MCTKPVAGPAWSAAARQRQRVRASSGRAWPVQPRRGPSGTAALHTQQLRPQLELHARQSRRLSPPRSPRTSRGWCSAGAPKAMRPPLRCTLLNSMRQRPCRRPLRARATPPPQQLQAPRRRALLNGVSRHLRGCRLSARAAAASRQRATCATTRRPRMMWTCLAWTRLALMTAPPSLVTACMQVGHAACPWQSS